LLKLIHYTLVSRVGRVDERRARMECRGLGHGGSVPHPDCPDQAVTITVIPRPSRILVTLTEINMQRPH